MMANPSDTLFLEHIDSAVALRNNGESERALERLLALRSSKAFKNISCTTLSNWFHRIGVCYYDLDLMDQALSYFRDSSLTIRLSCLGRKHVETANSHFTVAMIYRYLDEKHEAVNWLKQAIDILESLEIKDTSKIAYRYLQLGSLHDDLGDYGISEKYLMQALHYYRRLEEENSSRYAELHNILGGLKLELSKPKEALELLKKGVQIYQNIGARKYESSIASLYFNAARAYYEMGNTERARAYVLSAKEINVRLENLRGISEDDHFLGVINRHEKRYAQALENYQQSLVLRRKLSNGQPSRLIAYSYENMAAVYIDLEDFDTALQYYKMALQNLLPDFQESSLASNPSIRSSAIAHKLDVIRILGLKAEAFRLRYDKMPKEENLHVALETYHHLDSLIELARREYRTAASKYHLIKTTVPIYEAAIRTALQLYVLRDKAEFLREAFAFSAKNKAVLMLEGLQELALRNEVIPEQLLKQEAQLKQQYFALEAQIYEQLKEKKKPVDSLKQALFTVRRAYDKLIDVFERDYASYYELRYRFPKAADLDRVQTALPEDAALIEYFVGEEKLYTFCLSKTGLRYYEAALPSNFREQCLAFYHFLSDRERHDQQRYTELSQPLHELLLAPALNALDSNIQRLIFIPDDILLKLSFDVFPLHPRSHTDQDQPLLIDRYAISYAYSSKLLYNKPQSEALQDKATYKGFGLRYDNRTIAEINQAFLLDSNETKRAVGILPYACDEVQQIAELLGGEVWLNEAASKQNFLREATSSTILHMAGHAIAYEDHPPSSALIFSSKADSSDFMLRLGDIYGMRVDADMMVLSACNTGVGAVMRGEGVRNLARAFTFAGCSSLLASLWSVNDASSIKITRKFYEHLKAGEPKDVALQKAKNYYRQYESSRSQSAPYYWSTMVMIGDVSPLQLDKPQKVLSKWLLPAGALLGLLFLIGRWRKRAA